MKNVDKVEVFLGSAHVGTIAQVDRGHTAFQYDATWIADGFSISPISLPLTNKLFIAESDPFDGLFGVFNDSLPDGWGHLIIDRYLLKHGITPNEITSLTRLTLLPQEKSGALRYKPSEASVTEYKSLDLDELYKETKEILEDKDSSAFIDKFFILGSSSNGARPKIGLKMNNESWIVKFPSFYDSKDMGLMEFEYNKIARKCRIEVPEFSLLKSNLCKGFFTTKRFDRPNLVHMVSASGLLETSHRVPALDYKHLFKLSWLLSKDVNELQRVFDLMCFNVFSHNQDDHSKNFSFLYNLQQKRWRLSPAYDLTYSSTAWNEQSTTVNGKGKDIGIEDVVELGVQSGLERKELLCRAQEIKDATSYLDKYKTK